MKNPKLILLLIVLLGHVRTLVASPDPATLFYEGFIVLKKSNDTLRGFIQMGSAKYGKKYVVLRQDAEVRPIDKDEIALIRIFYKSGPDSLSQSTDFKALHFENNVIWRQLGSGKAEVYDNELFPDKEKFMFGKSEGDLSSANIYDLVVVTPGQAGPERILSSGVTWGVIKKRNHFLLEYLKKRYHSELKKSDFTSNGEMIRYIIEHG